MAAEKSISVVTVLVNEWMMMSAGMDGDGKKFRNILNVAVVSSSQRQQKAFNYMKHLIRTE